MDDEIRVTVCKYPDRKNLVLRYVDPITGKQITKSAGTDDEGNATKAAGKWEDELRTGRYQAPSRLTWADFRKRCEDEKLSAMCHTSQVAYRVALDHLERIIDPDLAAKLTPQIMSRFQAEARKQGMKATTLARHLRMIKACLRWGERQGLIAKAPIIEMPKLPKGQSLAKHRPPTAEEFDRMIAAIPKVRKNDAPVWERLLRGLWLSGLRLGEAMALDWNDGAVYPQHDREASSVPHRGGRAKVPAVGDCPPYTRLRGVDTCRNPSRAPRRQGVLYGGSDHRQTTEGTQHGRPRGVGYR